MFCNTYRYILFTLFNVMLLHQAAGDVVRLSSGGKALQTVVVAKGASERVVGVAATLAAYVKRISGAGFRVETGSGVTGIAVGTAAEFPGLMSATPFDNDEDEWRGREQYLLKSHRNGLWLIGVTDLAVEHAVWDLLYRLGYRQFFPGDNWEVVPSVRNLSIDVDVVERPDYLARYIWYGYGTWDYNVEPYKQWCARNRCVPGIQLNTGHAYDGIVRSARKAFEEHPEYWPLLDGQRQPVGNPKPCLSNPRVRELFVAGALERLSREPGIDSVSMDPSDGGGWCECEQCAKLGSVSDQAIMLANEVAVGINKKHPGKLVGIYAYNYHSPPPVVCVHPNVVVSVATAFIKGGLTLDEIIRGWSDRGATLGVREYYGVNVWDRDLPARARGGNLAYLARTIPDFHARGARFMSAESSDNWGPNGLGYYFAARMLWDVEEASRMDELTEDFLTRCFGPAKETMREFYRQLDGARPHLVFDDQLGRMFRSLEEAKRTVATRSKSRETSEDRSSPNSYESGSGYQRINARLNDLILYSRYVDLFNRYTTAKDQQRQVAYERMIRHSYRMRRSMMVHSKAIYRDVVARDKSVSIPDGTAWTVPEAGNPWKSSDPFTNDEFSTFVREGIERHPLVELDFEPVQFSDDLIPADSLKLAKVRPGSANRGRGSRVFYAYADQLPTTIELKITGGLIAHYRDRGNVRIELVKVGGASRSGERESVVASDRSVPPDGQTRTVSLPVEAAGLYKIQVSDGGDLTKVEWPPGQNICLESSLDRPIKTNDRWSLYFYVPRGTPVVGLFGGSTGTVIDSRGKKVFSLEGRQAGFYSIPVAKGTDGKLWQVHHAAGSIRLLTVPPYLARSADELLLPREVIERDRTPQDEKTESK